MANFRVERIFVRLAEPIRGLDPMKGIDPVELCWHATDLDAEILGLTPLSEFYAADYQGWTEDDKWFPASEGLETIRGLLAHFRRALKEGDALGRSEEVLRQTIELLHAVDNVLSVAAERGIEFCLRTTG